MIIRQDILSPNPIQVFSLSLGMFCIIGVSIGGVSGNCILGNVMHVWLSSGVY